MQRWPQKRTEDKNVGEQKKTLARKRIAVISCSAMRAVKFAIYTKDRRCFITNLCLVLFARNGRLEGRPLRLFLPLPSSEVAAGSLAWLLKSTTHTDIHIPLAHTHILCGSCARGNHEETILTLQTKNIT